MKKEKIMKAIAILTILCGLLTFISLFTSYLLSLYLSHKFNIDTRDAGSIGIIGGADGPTAVYLSGQISSHWFTVVFTTLAILGIIYLIFAKNSVKKP